MYISSKSLIAGIILGIVLGFVSCYSMSSRIFVDYYTEKISELESEISTIQSDLENRNLEITSLLSQIGDMNTQLGQKDAEISNLMLQIASLEAQMSEQGISDLLEENSVLQLTVTQLNSQISLLEVEISHLQEDLSVRELQINALEEQINDKNMQISTLLAQIIELEYQISDLHESISYLEQMLETRAEILNIKFSPLGGCEEEIIHWINKANASIHIMIYSFTLDSIGDALIEANKTRNVEVKAVFEEGQITSYSEYQKLRTEGIDVRNDTNSDGMHNKVMIVDGVIVVTGSFNWSAHAENENNENLIVIKSFNVATDYEDEFSEIWSESTP